MIAALFAVLCCASPEVVELQDGTQLVGTVLSQGEKIRIRTATGLHEVRAADTQWVRSRATLIRQLRLRSAAAPEIARAQLFLARWCLEQGLYDELLDRLDLILPSVGEERGAWDQLLKDAQSLTLLEDCAPHSDWSVLQVRGLAYLAGSGSPSRSLLAQRWLIDRQDPVVAEGLLMTLRSPKAKVRGSSAAILGERREPTALQALVELSLQDRAAEVRSAAVEAVIAYQHPNATLPYIQAVHSGKPVVRQAAYQALALQPDPRAVAPLIRRLAPVVQSGSDGPPRNHIHFGRQISYVQDFEVEIAQGSVIADPVIGILHEGSTLDVRVAASSSMPRVDRHRIAALLARLTGQNFGDDFESWASWWNENGEEDLRQTLGTLQSQGRPASQQPDEESPRKP